MSHWIITKYLAFNTKDTQNKSKYQNIKKKMIAHINDALYNEMWEVKEWVELFCNL